MHRILALAAEGLSPLAISAQTGLSILVIEAIIDSPLAVALRELAAKPDGDAGQDEDAG